MSKADILASCRLLYGNNAGIDINFLENIQYSELKTVFRQKALATHPDRFAGINKYQQRYFSELFIELKNAYEKLTAYLKQRDNGFTFRSTIHNKQHRTKKNNTAPPQQTKSSPFTRKKNVYKYVPDRQLRFGEFLYFSGFITIESLVRAILLQRKERERIGAIACRWGWISDKNLLKMLKEKRFGEHLGDVLLRHNIVTPLKLNILLRFQQISQNPIGEYFLKKKMITAIELNSLLESLRSHNFKYKV